LAVKFNNLELINKELLAFPQSELLVVTKNQKQENILLLIDKGYYKFGENRIMEAQEKFLPLKKKFSNLELHLIGPIQSNKLTLALSFFDCIHSLDRKKIIDLIIKFIANNKREVQTSQFYLQVNIGQELQKSGFKPQETQEIYIHCIKHGLPIVGLMCIPPNVPDPSIYFQQMKKLRNEINPTLKLSMGMSNDYRLALKNESNIIRVGSAIFDK